MTEKGPLDSAKGTTALALVTNVYLTADNKAAVLAEWERLKTTPLPPGDLCGKGWPDHEIIPLCDELNRLNGLCTLQSCAGHGKAGGGLWLWLDERTSERFVQWSHVLARMTGIDAVATKHTDWGQEVVAIDFDGRYDAAIKSVLIFFRTLMR